MLGRTHGPRDGGARADDRPGPRARRRRDGPRDRGGRPRLRGGRPDRGRPRPGAGADRDPARGRARERLAQPQRPERLARLHGGRARGRAGLRPLPRRGRRPARRLRLCGLAEPTAGPSGLGDRPRAGHHGQPRPARAAGRRRRPRPADRRRGRLTARRGREHRLPRHPDRRPDDALEPGLPGAASRGGRGGGARSRVRLPLRRRRRCGRMGLLVREPRGAPAQLRGAGRLRTRGREGGARDAARARDERRRRARRRLDHRGAPPPRDPVERRGARVAAHGPPRGGGGGASRGLAGERAHGHVGARLPARLPTGCADDVRGHARAGGRADPGRAAGLADRRRGDRGQSVRALQRAGAADPCRQPARDHVRPRLHERLRRLPPGRRGPRPARRRPARRPARPGALPLGVRDHELERRAGRGRARRRRERRRSWRASL